MTSFCPDNPLAGECRWQSLTIGKTRIRLETLFGREEDRPTLKVLGWSCAGADGLLLDVASTGPCVGYRDQAWLDLRKPGRIVPKAEAQKRFPPAGQTQPLSYPHL